jgi:hypothetical protein
LLLASTALLAAGCGAEAAVDTPEAGATARAKRSVLPWHRRLPHLRAARTVDSHVELVGRAPPRDDAPDERPAACGGVTCPEGQGCVIAQPMCLHEPCPPAARCVCLAKAACITGAQWDDVACRCKAPCEDVTCPGDQRCVAHGNAIACEPAACSGAATLDPETGACACDASGACEGGQAWNADPAICGCTPGCTVDAECAAVSDDCSGCACRALASGAPPPACAAPRAECFADPCRDRVARCRSGACVVE